MVAVGITVGITVGIGIIQLPGAATQNFASVAGTATTGLHAGIHGRTNKDVRQVLAALREKYELLRRGAASFCRRAILDSPWPLGEEKNSPKFEILSLRIRP
jgi:hypothetical protein